VIASWKVREMVQLVLAPAQKRIYEEQSLHLAIGPDCEATCRSLCCDEEIGILTLLRAVQKSFALLPSFSAL
jgi:hypothetical protein